MTNLVKGNQKKLNGSYSGVDTSFNSESREGIVLPKRGSSIQSGFRKRDRPSSKNEADSKRNHSGNKMNEEESDSFELHLDDSKRSVDNSFNSEESGHSSPREAHGTKSYSDNESNEEESDSSDRLSECRMQVTSNRIKMRAYYEHKCIAVDFHIVKR